MIEEGSGDRLLRHAVSRGDNEALFYAPTFVENDETAAVAHGQDTRLRGVCCQRGPYPGHVEGVNHAAGLSVNLSSVRHARNAQFQSAHDRIRREHAHRAGPLRRKSAFREPDLDAMPGRKKPNKAVPYGSPLPLPSSPDV